MNENLIHIKLEYDEALQSKRDILSSEIGLLKMAKAIKTHRSIRSEELKTKIKLLKKIKDVKANISKLQQTLPKLKTLNILKKDEEIKDERFKEENPKKVDDLEIELQEIQARLREIG